MVDKLGDLTRSYWPVAAWLLGAAVAYGALYSTTSSTSSQVRELSETVRRIEVGLAGDQERQKGNSTRIADLSDRIRALEQRAASPWQGQVRP